MDIDIDLEKRYKISEASELLNVKEYYIRNVEKYVGITYPVDDSGIKFLTHKQIELLQEVIELKEEKGHSYASIKRKFLEEGKIEENETNALENTSLDQMTIVDLKKTIDKMYMQIIVEREEKMVEEFEKKLNQQKNQIIDEVTRSVAERTREQMKCENQKLIDAIREMRESEKVPFWKKMFKKK